MSEDGAPSGEEGGEIAGPQRPRIQQKRRARISWIWLVPLLATVIGLSLVVKAWMHRGPTVTISFDSADGLEVGQTKVRYKDVVVGMVTGLSVSPDRKKVLVQAELNRDGAEYFTRPGTRYWVVRPRLGLGGVSGLGTLLSGFYISVDPPRASQLDVSEHVLEFKGLEKPPEITSGRPGTRYQLNASELGSLDLGSPVYLRQIQVGRVIGHQLNEDGKSVSIQVFVDAPNDKFVTTDARFWNSGGVDISVSADGLSIETGTLATIIAGGISFLPDPEGSNTPAPADTVFALKASRQEALAEPDGPALRIALHFSQSVRGLKVGAPVDFRGLELGEVVDIDLEFNPDTRRFYAEVKVDLYPMRFGALYENLINNRHGSDNLGHVLLAPMVQHGLRGQMRAASLITGQQYIALDFFPDAEPAEFDENRRPFLLPTVSGSFDRLQQQASSIVDKIDKIEFSEINDDLRKSLQSLTKLLDGLGATVTPQATSTLKAARGSLQRLDKMLAPDSTLNDNLDNTMRELANAARSLRALADFLRVNPGALIHGRAPDVLPSGPSTMKRTLPH